MNLSSRCLQVTTTQSLEGSWEERDANSPELLPGVEARLGLGKPITPGLKTRVVVSMRPLESWGEEQSA